MTVPTVWLPILFKISYFYVKQKKETNIGLEQLEGEYARIFIFGVNYSSNSSYTLFDFQHSMINCLKCNTVYITLLQCDMLT